MNSFHSAESTLIKAQGMFYYNIIEFQKTDENQAMEVIYEFLNSNKAVTNKRKYWNISTENLILLFIDLTVRNKNLRLLKEGLNSYRYLVPIDQSDSLLKVLIITKEMVEKRLNEAKPSTGPVTLASEFESDYFSPERLLMDAFQEEENNDSNSFQAMQKFMWETYKIILDIMKTNDKFLKDYAKTLENAFEFCRTHKKKNEFKRLCDSVRGFFFTLIKTEKVNLSHVNKINISKPEVLNVLIKMRLNLLNSALELEQWQECFKTSEDLVYLMDRYENTVNDKGKKNRLYI